jgi:hypothetical protein
VHTKYDGLGGRIFSSPVIRATERDPLSFASQQAQREPDHAATVAKHAVDGEVSLAGIGRPENRN